MGHKASKTTQPSKPSLNLKPNNSSSNRSTHTTQLTLGRCTQIAWPSSPSPQRQVSLPPIRTNRTRMHGSRCPTSVDSSTATFSQLPTATASMEEKWAPTWSKGCHSSLKLRWGSCSKSTTNSCLSSNQMRLWTPTRFASLSTTRFWIATTSCSRALWISAFQAPLVSASWPWAKNFSASMLATQEALLSSMLSRVKLWLRPSAEIRSRARMTRRRVSLTAVVA